MGRIHSPMKITNWPGPTDRRLRWGSSAPALGSMTQFGLRLGGRLPGGSQRVHRWQQRRRCCRACLLLHWLAGPRWSGRLQLACAAAHSEPGEFQGRPVKRAVDRCPAPGLAYPRPVPAAGAAPARPPSPAAVDEPASGPPAPRIDYFSASRSHSTCFP